MYDVWCTCKDHGAVGASQRYVDDEIIQIVKKGKQPQLHLSTTTTRTTEATTTTGMTKATTEATHRHEKSNNKRNNSSNNKETKVKECEEDGAYILFRGTIIYRGYILTAGPEGGSPAP